MSQTKFIAGHGQSRTAATPVRIACNCWQNRREPAIRPSGHRKPKLARPGRRIGRRLGGPGDDARSRRAGGSSRVERRRTIPARAVELSSAAERAQSDRCRATSPCAGGSPARGLRQGPAGRRRDGNGRIDRVPDGSRPVAPDVAAGKTVPCCRPKGKICPARPATIGRERSTGGPAPIGAPWPKHRGCNGFRRGAGDLENGQPSESLHPAHSCRSHSLSRTRVRLFADEAFMIRW